VTSRITWLAALLVVGGLLTASPAAASSITSLTAPTLSSSAATVQHVRYTFSFTATSLLVNGGNIVITGPTGTVMPTVAQIHNNTANTSFSRSGVRTNVNRTLTVNLCCTDTINPGDNVTVTLDDVTNGSAAPSPTLDVSTSSDTTPVTSPPYTLDATNPVTGVTAPSLSSTAASAQHVRYSFSFNTSTGNGGLVQPGTITIAAPNGTTLPAVAQIRDDTTSATFSRSGVRTNSNATLTVSLCCTDAINAGDHVTVTLDDVTNAGAGSRTLDISTSSNPTPVTSQSYTLDATNPITTVTAPSLSSTAGGVQHVRYSFSFNTSTGNGGLVAPGTITIAAPPGTVLPGFAQIRDDTAGTSFGRSGARTNGNATLTLSLCCTDAISAGDHVTVTLDDVTNAASGANYTFNVSTSSNPTPVASQTYSLTAPEQVTGVSGVSLSSVAGGIDHVRYSFGFTASGSTGSLVAPGTIKIVAPPGTILPAFAQLRDDTAGTSFSRSGVLSNGSATLTLSLCCTDAINSADHVTVTIDDVTNPASGSGYTFDVSTSSNPTPVTSPAYSLSAPQQVTGVTAVTATTDAKGKVSDSFSFTTSPTGGLVPPGTITIAATAGTVLPAVAQIRDNTTGATFTRSGALSNANATLKVSLCCTDSISPGDTVTVTLADVTNPAGGAGPFQVSTSSDTGAVTTPPPGSGPPPPVVPPPIVGKRATAVAEKGSVRVKLPGNKGFVALTDATSIPVGSTLDTTRGQVGLTFATDTTGGTQRGSFSEGQFQVQQTSKNHLTTLSMVAGGLNGCKAKLPKGGSPKQSVGAAGKRRRTLFSSVKGRFRTRGRNSSATVRGTKWRVTDTCSGTKTTVTQGSVMVRDLTLKRNVLVKAGHSYLARAPLRKKKKRR
jgi:hypothetical protein